MFKYRNSCLIDQLRQKSMEYSKLTSHMNSLYKQVNGIKLKTNKWWPLIMISLQNSIKSSVELLDKNFLNWWRQFNLKMSDRCTKQAMSTQWSVGAFDTKRTSSQRAIGHHRQNWKGITKLRRQFAISKIRKYQKSTSC